MGYILFYTISLSLSAWQFSWAIAGNAQTTPVFEAKFGWTEDETILYNTIISSSGVVGLTIGSFMGGRLLSLGRRKAMIVAQLIAITGSLVSMIGVTWALTLGRIFVGISSGISNPVFGRFVVENMPGELAAKLSMFQGISICSGLFVCFLLGGILPDPDNF